MENSSGLIIYTDGGCSGNPGPGGWAYVIIDGNPSGAAKEITGSSGEKQTTNNRMELTAVISAFEYVCANPSLSGREVSVYVDSQYVKDGITKWIVNWKRNGWRTASKDPVKNQDLWIRLDGLTAEVQPKWFWVKGHAGNKYNELVDGLTQDEIAKFR